MYAIFTALAHLLSHNGGLNNANAKHRFFNAKDLNASPGPEGLASKSQERNIVAMRFFNASVLPRKSLNRKLFWVFFGLGKLLSWEIGQEQGKSLGHGRVQHVFGDPSADVL